MTKEGLVRLRQARLPRPRINLSEIIKAFQTAVVAEQARERLKQIKRLAVNPAVL